MRTLELEQGSEAWKLARLGKVGASRVADVVATLRSGGYGASREAYMSELLVERLTGVPTEGYVNQAMQWGIDTEKQARAAYEFERDCDVEQVGFIPHPKILMAGASPDGFVGKNGLVEIKCPERHTHWATLLKKAIPEKYLTQIMFQLAVTGRQWCDYVSFDPRFPEQMQLYVQTITRNDTVIAKLEREVLLFLKELDDNVIAAVREYGVTPKVLAA